MRNENGYKMSVTSQGNRFKAAQLCLLRGPALLRKLPGLATAFDPDAMQNHLQAALFGEMHANYTIKCCTPDKPTYLAGEGCCILCYELEIRNNIGGTLTSLVNARIFSSQTVCESYMHDRLAPLAALMVDRVEIAPFATPVAMLEPLNMVVSVFPIDDELPMLVGATDRQCMSKVFQAILPDVLADGLTIENCKIELHQYKHRRSCVLRYQVESRPPGADQTQLMVVYGKVANKRCGPVSVEAIETLRKQVLDSNWAHSFNIPRPLGYWPDLQLTLLAAIPGKRRIYKLLKMRPGGAPDSKPETLMLEEALVTSARIAAVLHISGVTLGRHRTLNDELAGLRLAISAVRPMSPEFGRQLQVWFEQVEADAGASDPLPLCFSHGDFTYKQLLFDGTVGGLVDFDTVCQAEPALDLGQFLAYLRVAMLKVQESASPVPGALTEQLCRRFLDTYVAASGDKLVDEEQLRIRVSVYQAISLLRIAVHSWQKFKSNRLNHVITLIEELIV